MNYRYRLVIEDTTKSQEILVVAGHGTSKTQTTCLKSVRQTINASIREMLTGQEEAVPAAGEPRYG